MIMLDVDTNMKLAIPELYPNIVRTGTVPEGSCFFHSVLKGLNNDNYSNMSKSEKKMYAKKLRENIAESITLDYYKNNIISISSLRLSTKLSEFLEILYKFIENPKDFLKKDKSINFLENIINDNIVVFKMIVTVMTKEEFTGIIQKPFITSSTTIDNYIKNYNTSLFQLFVEKLNEEDIKLNEDKLDICKTKIKRFVESTCNFIVEKQYTQYKKELKNTSNWADDLMFQISSDFLDVDVYFIDANSKKVYVDHVIKRNRPSVVVGWINNSHFENIGVLEDKHIKRLFEPDHPFILKIKENL